MKNIIKLILLISTTLHSCNNSAQTNIKPDTLQTSEVTKSEQFFSYENTVSELVKLTDTANIKRFQAEINQFLKTDSLQKIKPGKILFIGSSSIRKWKSLETDFKSVPIIKRGFGGSTVAEIIFYTPQIIIPYKPRKIFFYAGENDISQNKISAEKLADIFILFSKMINYYLPETKIYFISIKPSPSRRQYTQEFTKANNLIKQFCETDKNLFYIDIFSKMLNENGSVKENIFVTDKLHLNENGYKIWRQTILPFL